jgi:hypothetical protein
MTSKSKKRREPPRRQPWSPTLYAPRRHRVEPHLCPTCDALRAEGTNMHPPHDPSPYCESGKHDHCTCDWCF